MKFRGASLKAALALLLVGSSAPTPASASGVGRAGGGRTTAAGAVHGTGGRAAVAGLPALGDFIRPVLSAPSAVPAPISASVVDASQREAAVAVAPPIASADAPKIPAAFPVTAPSDETRVAAQEVGESGALARGVEALRLTVASFESQPENGAQAAARLYGEDLQSRFVAENAPARRAWDGFVKPNELHPEKAKGILAAAGEGLYASVGTERGFIGAALAPRVTHLLLMDRSAGVAEYNRMNVALLRLARDRAEYRRLRTRGDARQAAALAAERGLPAAERALLGDPAAWSQWRAAQNGNALNVPSGGAFRGSNYLLDDELFTRLKSMADGGRIAVTRAVFDDPESVRRLTDGIDATGVPVSVLDISNAWWSGYLPRRALRGLLESAKAVARPDAVFLITDGTASDGWTYHGFMLRAAVDGWKAMRRSLDKVVSGRVSRPGTLTSPALPEQSYYDRYVQPNERHPEHAASILARAPAGAYVSVGTERGFIGAALAPRADALLLVDRDPAVATYNRVNLALLRLARDREEYARLRVADHAVIVRMARERGVSMRDRLVLEDPADWEVWIGDQNGHPMLAAADSGEFAGSNYLRDDALFARLKTLADAGRVTVLQADLSRGEGAARLAGALRSLGRPVSVMDLSNAWRSYYLPHLALLRVLWGTRERAAADAVLMLTDRAERRESGTLGWDYFGFRLDRLAANPWLWLARLWRIDPGSWTMYSSETERHLRSRFARNTLNP